MRNTLSHLRELWNFAINILFAWGNILCCESPYIPNENWWEHGVLFICNMLGYCLCCPEGAFSMCYCLLLSSCLLSVFLPVFVNVCSSRDWNAHCPSRPWCAARAWRTSFRGPTATLACPPTLSLTHHRLLLRCHPAPLSLANAHPPFHRLLAPTPPSVPTHHLSAFLHHCLQSLPKLRLTTVFRTTFFGSPPTASTASTW